MDQDPTLHALRADGSTPEAPIIRRTLHDELLDRLRQMIFDGDLAPGTKVPEKELCDRFHVSRTPLREALKVLANEGLVTLTPNRGAMISQVTLADLEEAFPVMGALESLSGEMACAHITDTELAEIRTLHERMVEHFQARELGPYFKLNQQIHERILDAARNPTLLAMHRSLAGRIRHARYIANMSAARWAEAVREHSEILEALEVRDGPLLAQLLKAHMANKFETVRQGLSDRAEAE